MNILYIAFKDFSILHYGASKKVLSECRALEELGHTVTLVGQSQGNTAIIDVDGNRKIIGLHKPFYIKKVQPLFDKQHQIKDVLKYTKKKKYDLCYIRFDLNTRNFIELLKNLQKVCKKILIEIPTYPYSKEYTGKLNQIRLKIDDHYAKFIYKYVDKIISFYEIPGSKYYDVPVQVVSNGFDFDETEVISNNSISDVIEIAAVSSMRIWHGYERFIEGLYKYYHDGGRRQILFHIVGDGREGSKYKELVKKYELFDHVIFHGAMHGKELDQLLEQCTLGVDSLARHRTGISVLSSLKSREYGAKGIPIINSCKIDIIDDDFKYFLQVPADETPINMEQIISFYDGIYKGKERAEIAKEIRNYIECKSSMCAVMRMIIEEKSNV